MVLPVTARGTWNASRLPAVVIPHAVGEALARDVRSRIARAPTTRYGLLDRASYSFVDRTNETEVFEALVGIACEVTGRSLVLAESRALVLDPGDYVLLRHDRVHDDNPVELVLDLSASPVPGAEVHYRHRGQVFFTFASTPGALAIVERGPSVMCNHTYVSKRLHGACVVRMVMLLRPC